jgi:hypothetical protein
MSTLSYNAAMSKPIYSDHEHGGRKTSETMVSTCKNTWCHITVDHNQKSILEITDAT